VRPVPPIVASLLVVASLAAAAGDRAIVRADEIRVVRSSLGAGSSALPLSTKALYAKNDPWKGYLASERVCPGGERVDLPLARQVETVACLVNYARQRRGLSILPIRSVLNGASINKAKAIVRCQNFAHNPCGGDWTSSVRAAGYGGAVGENLYLASGRFGAPRVAVDAWLNSDAHRKTLFRREWSAQGLAVLSQESFGGHSEVSLWVSVLGKSGQR